MVNTFMPIYSVNGLTLVKYLDDRVIWLDMFI